jgi:hypothetical protein
MHFQRTNLPVLGVFVFAIAAARSLTAADVYVDNLRGDDICDGGSPKPVDERSGPVRTIRRGLKMILPGDTLYLANTGVPYYESLEIVGPRFNGGFTLEGNGAVVSGAKIVPFDAWKYMGDEVWRFRPRRKAFYQLISGEKALPEFPCPPGTATLPEIPAGHWCAWRGAIYYRALPGRSQTQNDPPLSFAAEEVGITLLDVEEAVIHNLELRHFRLDGVNAHDRCRRVVLDAVRLIENGRAGLAVGGSSTVGIKDSTVQGNRLVSILNAEVAQTEVLTSQLGPAGVLAPERGPFRITGGHVLVDNEEVFENPRPEPSP